jgi:ABC-2 type transport system ATP-binding protein
MPAISFQHVCKTYSSPQKKDHYSGSIASSDVSFDIQAGRVFLVCSVPMALAKPLISILAGLSRASSGHVFVHGSDVVKDYAKARRCWAWCRKSWCLTLFTVHGCTPVQATSASKNDDGLTSLLVNGTGGQSQCQHAPASIGGMKRRVLVAQALVHKPPGYCAGRAPAWTSNFDKLAIHRQTQQTGQHGAVDHPLFGRAEALC